MIGYLIEQFTLKMQTVVGITNFTFVKRHLVVKIVIYMFTFFIFSTTVLIRHTWQLKAIEQHVLDTNKRKQLSLAATDVLLTLLLER